jgi:hypothetical protein
MGSEIEDPNLADLPEEAFEEPGEGGLSVPQLELRIRAKREQAMQDAGAIAPPQPDAPLEQPEQPEEEPEPEAEPEPEEPEPLEPEEPQEPEAEGEQEDFFFARYKTKEEAERGKAEADATIDRLYRERAQWQQQQEQQAQGEQQEFDPQAWNEWAAEAVSNGAGEQGALAALNNGGTQAYDVYLAHWAAEPDQLVVALAFNNDVQRHLATQHALAAVSPLLEEQQHRVVENEAIRARSTVASRHPDFDDLEQEMDRMVLEEDGVLDAAQKQWLEDTARTQGLQGKINVLEYLYRMASQNVSPSRRQAQATERRRRKETSDAAKVSATVSSSEATGTRTPLSEAELTVLAKKNSIRAKLGQPLLPTE